MRLNKTTSEFYFNKYANKFGIYTMDDFLAKHKLLLSAQLHKNLEYCI